MAGLAPTEETRRRQRLLIGPWNHASGQLRPDADPSAGFFVDYSADSPTMRFLAHHLKGDFPDYDDEPPVQIYVMGENTWRSENEWPLARTAWTSFFLHGPDGRLSADSPGDEEPDSFVYDPRNPAPGSITLGAMYNDPVDLDAVGARSDVLVYATEPFAHAMEITGPVAVELWASTTAPSTDFTAKLIEVFADGTTTALCQGIIRTGLGDESSEPGAAFPHVIDLVATSVVVRAGHRLRLDISSSEYPTFEPNPNTGNRITHDDQMQTATQRVYHDEQRPSRLILPVIPR